MNPGFRLAAAALSLTLLPLAATADPVVTDSSVITNERRVAILEAKLASLRLQVALLEDAKAIERANRLLCVYARAILDRHLPTMDFVLEGAE